MNKRIRKKKHSFITRMLIELDVIDRTCPFSFKDPVELTNTCLKFETCRKCRFYQTGYIAPHRKNLAKKIRLYKKIQDEKYASNLNDIIKTMDITKMGAGCKNFDKE